MKRHRLIIGSTQKVEGVPEVIQLLPFGKITSTKGDFNVDEESYRLMNSAMSTHGVDIVIDYEHQTLSGGKAPAAGWIKELILTSSGIDARVEWTKEAGDYLSSKQYRYTSPVLLARRGDNKAVKLLSLALTNSPAIDGMTPIINSDFYDDEGEDDIMDFLKALAKLLGLPETATGDELLTAVTTLLQKSEEQSKLVVNSMLAPLLGVDAAADLPTVSAKILALTAHSEFVPRNQYDQVKAKLDKLEGDGLVGLALKDGKITPAQKGWAERYVLTDRDGFAKFLDCAVPTVPMGETQLAKTAEAGLSSDTMLICKNMGVSEEDVKLYGGK